MRVKIHNCALLLDFLALFWLYCIHALIFWNKPWGAWCFSVYSGTGRCNTLIGGSHSGIVGGVNKIGLHRGGRHFPPCSLPPLWETLSLEIAVKTQFQQHVALKLPLYFYLLIVFWLLLLSSLSLLWSSIMPMPTEMPTA